MRLFLLLPMQTRLLVVCLHKRGLAIHECIRESVICDSSWLKPLRLRSIDSIIRYKSVTPWRNANDGTVFEVSFIHVVQCCLFDDHRVLFVRLVQRLCYLLLTLSDQSWSLNRKSEKVMAFPRHAAVGTPESSGNEPGTVMLDEIQIVVD